MRIVCLITVGAFLLTIAVAAETDEQVGETAARVPRALVLQPVMKVKEDEDEGPFDWMVNLFRGMSPQKKKVQVQGPPPMLGPIRIPGVDDEVYIKQLNGLANANSRVVVRVVNPQMPQAPVQMGSAMAIPTPYYTYQTPQYQIAPTRQVPIQSSGFVPISSSASSGQWQQPRHIRPQYPQNYGRPMYQNGYNYGSPHYPYPPQYPPPHNPYYPAYYPRYPHNPYGSYDFDNSISHGNREPWRATSYTTEVNHDTPEIVNHTITSEESYDEPSDSEIQYVDQTKVSPTSKSTDKYKEIYRPDRMVPTNPTWRNRFWTRTQKNKTSIDKNNNDKNKFSSTDMIEISPPDFKDEKNHEKKSDSRMDEDHDIIKDETILAKGESQEIEKRIINILPTSSIENSQIHERTSVRKKFNQKSLESKTTQPSPIYIAPKNIESTSTTTTTTEKSHKEIVTDRSETATPEVLKKIVNQSTENSWKHHDFKRPGKTYQRKNNKNSNRRVRIVESVRSSVSVTSSKGKQVKSKPKN